MVTGNRIGNTGDNDTQAYGILVIGDSDENLIYGNDLTGNTIKAIETVGANTKVWGNVGVEED